MVLCIDCAARHVGQYAVSIPTMRELITTNYPFQMPLIINSAVHFKVVKKLDNSSLSDKGF